MRQKKRKGGIGRNLLGLTTITLISWVLAHHPQLSFYNLQFVALLAVILIGKNLLRPKSFGQTDLLLIAAVIALIVFNTGGPVSPFFFLFYFLLFAISFLSAPELAIGLALILIIFLSPQIGSTTDLLEAFSLVLVSPLALFFGQQYLKILTDQKRIKILQQKWLDDEKTLESEENNTLLWLSLNFRRTITEILEITAKLLSDISQTSPNQKSLLKKTRRKLKKLLKEGEILEKMVDRASDE